MLHDEQLFAGIQARIGLYLLVGQRTKFLAAALGEEKRAVDNVIRYAIAIPQEAVFRQTEELGFFVAHQQDIRIIKRFDGLNETTHNSLHARQAAVDLLDIRIFGGFYDQNTHEIIAHNPDWFEDEDEAWDEWEND